MGSQENLVMSTSFSMPSRAIYFSLGITWSNGKDVKGSPNEPKRDSKRSKAKGAFRRVSIKMSITPYKGFHQGASAVPNGANIDMGLMAAPLIGGKARAPSVAGTWASEKVRCQY